MKIKRKQNKKYQKEKKRKISIEKESKKKEWQRHRETKVKESLRHEKEDECHCLTTTRREHTLSCPKENTHTLDDDKTTTVSVCSNGISICSFSVAQ